METKEIMYPYAKKCACNMHVTTNYMHVMVNMHVTLLLHECYMHSGNGSVCTMHVVRVLSNMHVGSACNMHVTCMLYEGCNTIGAHLTICK